MPRLSIGICLTVAVSLVLGVCSSDAVNGQQPSWPQWRGPARDDVSQERGLLQSWPAEGPKRDWLFTNTGKGYSGPAIVGERLFIMGGRDGTEQLISINIKNGKEVWAADVGDTLPNRWGDGPRGTPTVDGGRVYALGGQGNLICAKTEDGAVLWQCSMSDFGGRKPGWGYCESVLIDGDKLLCTPGGKQGAVLALDKATGKKIWQSTDFTDGAQYASIIAIEHDGQRQYVQLTQKHLVGLDVEKGDLLWSSDWQGRTAVVPTPIFHEGHVYVSSGYGVGCKLVKLDGSKSPKDVYQNKVMKNQHGGVLLKDGHLFGYSDGVGWACQDFLGGELVWKEKSKLGKGAITYADGRFYCLEERTGDVALVGASSEGYEEFGRFTLSPQSEIRSRSGKIWTHPVVVGGKLFLRDQDLLYCYDVKQR